MLAVQIRKLDTKSIEKDLWDKKTLPPSWLDKLTPHEFATMFLRSSNDDEEAIADALMMMVKVNRERGQSGQRPFIPPSLLGEQNPRRPKADQVAVPEPVGGMVNAAPMWPVRW